MVWASSVWAPGVWAPGVWEGMFGGGGSTLISRGAGRARTPRVNVANDDAEVMKMIQAALEKLEKL